MGKKRTLEDKTKYAFSNGYVENDATVDSKPVRPEPLDYTRGCYETQLELWDQ
jgi:hypothetical protein